LSIINEAYVIRRTVI